MTQSMPPDDTDTYGARRARHFRAAAAAVCVLGLAATVVFYTLPHAGSSNTVPRLAAMPAAAATDDYLHTPARDLSVPRAQDVFAAPKAADDESPPPPTF